MAWVIMDDQRHWRHWMWWNRRAAAVADDEEDGYGEDNDDNEADGYCNSGVVVVAVAVDGAYHCYL
jgi:hypothetical protein